MNIIASLDPHRSSFDALNSIPQVALDAIPAAVYVVDADGVIVRYNERAAKIWGRYPDPSTPERYCGAHRLFHVDGRDLPHDETPMVDALLTLTSQRDMEVVIEREDGGRSIVLVNIEPLIDAEGTLRGAINCFQDITEKKELERQLRESQAFLQAVIDTTPECIKIVNKDGQLVRMNQAGAAMLGATDSSVVEGLPTADLIAPEDRERWKEHHDSVVAGSRLRWEFDVVGLDGRRRNMESHAAPFVLPDGEPAQLAVTRDITSRKAEESAREESERRHREILEAMPAAIYTTDKEGRITFYNQAAVAFSGNKPVVGSDSWCVSYKLFRPDGTFLPHDQCPMAIALKEQRATLGEYEAIAERPDGSRVPFMPFATPLFDSDGVLTGAVNMLVDITERKKAEEQQKLLIDELNHRVKNTLAIVQSLASQTAKNSNSIQSFTHSFSDRLQALSQAHDLLAKTGWAHASLVDVVSLTLKPFKGEVLADGPTMAIAPAAALSLTMVLHELATNAAKYGALSQDTGKVTVAWEIVPADQTTFRLHWSETGGPVVTPPDQHGFGTKLIERSVGRDLAGRVELNFKPEGFQCALEMPLNEISGPTLG
ncbi:PAS domain S-box protein [Mesorhizobium sp. NBSH29]|uniref:sensor histidine kinase n=1 Tax=Mesorhizobium sp. NBSH29 TaxID=2654249 RepID=UPI00189686D3|nr:PAS domain S-box protein [Mesorhizobium sp. NBSH29]QPC86961.1 PAS domain S-box protein [Mesorhizobium sp. NBSH29]